MAVTILLPGQFKRQFAAPVDVDQVFSTTAARTAYLTNPRRYPGMIVSDLETQLAYQLNTAGSAWIALGGSGGGSVDTMEFAPGDPGAPAIGATTYSPAGNAFLNKKVLVFRNGLLQRPLDPGDGNTYITKVFASNTLTFSHALIATDYIQILIATL